MTWKPANNGIARIGGIIFRNVERPLLSDEHDNVLISLSRNTKTGELGVSMSIYDTDGYIIGKVENNIVYLDKGSDYIEMNTHCRKAVVHKNRKTAVCDIIINKQSEIELEVSTLQFTKKGKVIILHPNRFKYNSINDNLPPFLMDLTLSTEENDKELVLVNLDENKSIYIHNVTIENVRSGIIVIAGNNVRGGFFFSPNM